MRFEQNRIRHAKNKKRQNKECFERIEHEKHERKIERGVFLDEIAGKFMLSPEMIHNASVITLNGRSFIRIENYKKIAEYSASCIRIHANNGILIVEGRNLEIRYYTKEEMVISGVLNTVSFV